MAKSCRFENVVLCCVWGFLTVFKLSLFRRLPKFFTYINQQQNLWLGLRLIIASHYPILPKPIQSHDVCQIFSLLFLCFRTLTGDDTHNSFSVYGRDVEVITSKASSSSLATAGSNKVYILTTNHFSWMPFLGFVVMCEIYIVGMYLSARPNHVKICKDELITSMIFQQNTQLYYAGLVS